MSNQTPPIFLRFIDGMLADGEWLLVESLLKMKTIKKIEEELKSRPLSKRPSGEQLQVIEDLNATKAITKNLNLLAKDILRILQALTKVTLKVFSHADMADRFAAMLNYFLESLTGKDRKQFKTSDPEALSFFPFQILQSLKNIYCCFSEERIFLIAVSQDGRSYDPKIFKEAASILGKKEQVDDFLNFLRDVILTSTEVEKENNFYADVPDDFLDPLMATIMRDPVILPSSQQTVDR